MEVLLHQNDLDLLSFPISEAAYSAAFLNGFCYNFIDPFYLDLNRHVLAIILHNICYFWLKLAVFWLIMVFIGNDE